jgi:hypothetical protein
MLLLFASNFLILFFFLLFILFYFVRTIFLIFLKSNSIGLTYRESHMMILKSIRFSHTNLFIKNEKNEKAFLIFLKSFPNFFSRESLGGIYLSHQFRRVPENQVVSKSTISE